MAEPRPSPVSEALDCLFQQWKTQILNTSFVINTSSGSLHIDEYRGFLSEFYVIIRDFPRWISQIIERLPPDRKLRALFRANLREERKHDSWWIDYANGLGVPTECLRSETNVPQVKALHHWLDAVNTSGTLVEAVSATNFAIEGIAQPVAAVGLSSIHHYQNILHVRINSTTLRWLEAHVRCDEEHPRQALALIAKYATSDRQQHQVKVAAEKSLELFSNCMEADYRSAWRANCD